MMTALGCSQMVTVKQDFDDYAPFDRFNTYAWLPIPADLGSATGKWQQADVAMRQAIDREMADKGFTKVDVNSDVLITYSFGTAEKGTGSGNFSVDYQLDYSNAEVWKTGGGILIIDMVNAKTEKLAWRGTAHVALNVDPTPEMVEKNINRAVEKVMGQYPPKVQKR